MKKLSSVPLTLFAWFLGGVFPIFFALYFVCVVALHYSTWFWIALVAAIPIVIVGVLWMQFMRRMTFHVRLDRGRKLLLHGQPLQGRPVTGKERCEFRRYGGIWYAYLQFPDGTGVSFIPGFFLYGKMKREGTQRQWSAMVNELP